MLEPEPPHVRFPDGLRLARPGDQASLLELFQTAHTENGFGGIDVDAVKTVIEKAVWQDEETKYVMAVIPGPHRIEACIGLQPAKLWYGTADDYFWSDLLVYVHPDHRRTKHAACLLRFADWWAENHGSQVILWVQPRSGLSRKTKFFSRFARLCGAAFVFGA